MSAAFDFRSVGIIRSPSGFAITCYYVTRQSLRASMSRALAFCPLTPLLLQVNGHRSLYTLTLPNGSAAEG